VQAPTRRSRRPGLGSILLGVVLGLIIAGIVGALLLPSFLRHRGDLPAERMMAEVAKEMTISREAASVQAPKDLTDRRTLNQGREAYTGACASCHGATGDGKGLFGQALYPDATNLLERDTQEKTDGQLFWIIKNGLSFGGMPAFADLYPDDTIWSMVGYIRALSQNPAAARPLAIPSPTTDDLAMADPHAQDAAIRGSATFMAKGCAGCHGPRGSAPGDLTIGPDRDSMASIDEFKAQLKKPDAAMPMYYPNHVSDQEVQDLYAYVQTFARRPPRR
jgi:mono/diheme cytochrome c family protein